MTATKLESGILRLNCSAFLFLDAKKAFDRVGHSFLIESLTAYGFGINFKKWVKLTNHKVLLR